MSNKIYDMTDVWNDINQSFSSIKMNTTDINSVVSSKLMDLQLNGVSKLTLNKLGQIREATLQIPQVDNLEDAITVLSAAGLSHVDFIVANTQLLNANLQFSNNALALVYKDPVLINNDYYYKVGASGTGSWSNTGIIPELIELLTPRKKVPRTFFVTMEGNDNDPNYHGQSYYKAKRTVEAGLAAAANVGEPCVVIVHPGEYPIQPQTVIPKNCALYGYDVRVTKLTPAWNQVASPNNMFLLSSGVKVRGFTFEGLRHEPFTLEGGPPKTGYAFAYKPDEYITRSPYISDCTQIHNLTYQQLSLPIDRAAGNPLCPFGGGNIYADGSVLDTDSPLRSVVVDSFTAVNPNGVAYAVVNDALAQLVSVFTNWSRVGVWAHQGGQITTTNSNSSFGDYAFASTGFRYVIRLNGVANTQNLVASANLGNYIANNMSTIVSTLMTRYETINGWSTISSNAVLANLTSRDTTTLLTELADDFRSGKDQGLQFFTYGLFTANSIGPFADVRYSVVLDNIDIFTKDMSVYVSNSTVRIANAQVYSIDSTSNTVIIKYTTGRVAEGYGLTSNSMPTIPDYLATLSNVAGFTPNIGVYVSNSTAIVANGFVYSVDTIAETVSIKTTIPVIEGYKITSNTTPTVNGMVLSVRTIQPSYAYGAIKSVSNSPTPPDYVFRTELKQKFLDSWDVVRSTLKDITANTQIAAGLRANNMIDEVFDLLANVVIYPEKFTIPFQSRIEATSQQFSYAGSGINYNALPYGQRATGVAPDPTTNLYSNNGGLIYATFSTEQGDTYLGKDLRIDFERSTIEGQAFARGVQNIALPLIIGVGG